MSMKPSNNNPFSSATGPVSIKMNNDYLFKALMQENRRVLRAFIADLLHVSHRDIKKLEIINPIKLGERVDDKVILLDVLVTFNNGTMMNIEMQVINEHNWVPRSVYYICRNGSSLREGQPYTEIRKIYQIGLLNFTLFPDHKKFYATYELSDVADHYAYTDLISIRVVDLSRIDLATEEDKRYNIDKWASLFKATTWEEIKMLSKNNQDISEAAYTAYRLSQEDRIRLECEAREDYLRRKIGMERERRQDKRDLAKARKLIVDMGAQLADKDAIIASLRAQLCGLK